MPRRPLPQARPPRRTKSVQPDELRTKLHEMHLIEAELRARDALMEPMYYGLPDLLFPKDMQQGWWDDEIYQTIRHPLPKPETDEEYKQRQNDALHSLVTVGLKVIKDDREINIRLIPAMTNLLCDLFFGRRSKVILWANRGGGKSLLAALFIWIMVVYRKRSVLNLAGAGNQARRVYDYTVQFWKQWPGMQDGMLLQKPLMQRTELKTGTKLICATSVTTAIGEHIGCSVVDEACSNRVGADNDIARAIQGTLSEPDPVILLLSTFHLPTGLFADFWDQAEDQGFDRIKWDCYECMSSCSYGLDYATDDDPKSLRFCFNQCELTRKETTYDAMGKPDGFKWIGCQGRARDTEGWLPRSAIVEAYNLNKGTSIFRTEHECTRPQLGSKIFDPTIIDRCITETVRINTTKPMAIGIDWGLTECAMCLLAEWEEENPEDPDAPLWGICVLDTVYMANKLVDEVIREIVKWQEEFGDEVRIRADGSHPYNNKQLRDCGYRVSPVMGDPKNMGMDNLSRWLVSGQFKILGHNKMLITQFKNLKRSMDTGKQIKKNVAGEHGDHGADCARMATMIYSFIQMRKLRMQEKEQRKKRTEEEAKPLRSRRPSLKSGLDRLLG